MRGSILSSAVAITALLAFGCGGPPPPETTINEQANVLPRGAIHGRVTDAMTGAPLGGVTVRTFASAALNATTGADGFYIINDVPAGSTYTVYFELDGYVRGVANAALLGAVGDFPAGNAVATRNLVMSRADSNLKGYVFGAQGKPAAGATVVVDLRSLGFDLVASTKAGPNGAYDLGGLPGFPAGLDAQVAVPPYDENGDGAPEYDLSVATIRLFSASTSFRVISIAPNGVGILSTNLADGDLAPADPINITFTAPMNVNLTTATLRNTSRNLNVAITRSWENEIALGIRAAGGTALSEADNHELTLNAVAQNGGTLSVTIPFKVRSSTTTVNPAVVAGTRIDSPTTYDWTTAGYSLSWTATSGATGYRVYVRDSTNNPSFVQVGNVVGSSPLPTASVTLPNGYDTFTADGVFTPLSFGNKVTFAVVSLDRYGNEGSLANANTVQVGDNLGPNVTQLTQTGNANNLTGAATTLRINLTFNEYMDVATNPTLSITTGALAGATTASWTWNASLTSGYFTLNIPANTDGRGNFSVLGAKDSSGNPMADITGQLRNTSELITNGGFEGCSLTGWIGAATSSTPQPAATTEMAYSGTCSGRVGNDTYLGTQATQAGDATVSQAFAIPTGVSSITASLRYRVYSTTAHEARSCVILNSTGSTIYTLFYDTSADNIWRLASTNISTAYAGSTMTLRCTTNQDGLHVSGMWLDDVSVSVQ